jgi:uncharacterized protein (UPF0276 family)
VSQTLVGFALPPDAETLERVQPLLARTELFEVTPETLWVEDGAGDLVPNGFHRRFLALARRLRRPVVAHGVGLSMGSSSALDRLRQVRWLSRLRKDHAAFRFRWYTEHLGAGSLAGQAMWLPMPVPMTAAVARVVRSGLRQMASVVPTVGIENNVAYFTFGDPLDEPRFIARCLRGGGHLLLDLHNVLTMALNHGFEPEAYLSRLELDRVIEIHVSGGSESDPRWLASGKRFRLDGHDGAVPDAVWWMLEHVLPRCPSLRAVVLERMEGTVGRPDVAVLRDELERIRRTLRRRR